MKKIMLWGFLLWLFGYALGIALFMVVPQDMLGWLIMPLGILTTYAVLYKKFGRLKSQEYWKIGAIWALMAIVLDYVLLVQVFKPSDGYYKLDVYLYYLITLIMPVFYHKYLSKKEK